MNVSTSNCIIAIVMYTNILKGGNSMVDAVGIEEIREELNALVAENDAILNQGKILTLSQELDKLLFIGGNLAINKVTLITQESV